MIDPFDYFCEEFFDDNDVLEICERCLRTRIASLIWARLDQHFLKFFLEIKKEHTLTMCPFCLQEQYEKSSQLKIN